MDMRGLSSASNLFEKSRNKIGTRLFIPMKHEFQDAGMILQ